MVVFLGSVQSINLLLLLAATALLVGSCMGLNISLPPACSSSGSSATGYLSGTQNVTISVNGVDRTFVLFVPFGDGSQSCYDAGPPATPRPLVINWHGEVPLALALSAPLSSADLSLTSQAAIDTCQSLTIILTSRA